MRQRFFWSIFGVAALLVILIGTAGWAIQRQVSIDATYQEMTRAAQETADLISEAVGASDVANVKAFVQSGELRPLLLRLQRAAGGSDLGVAFITPDGRTDSALPLVRQLDLDTSQLLAGQTQTLKLGPRTRPTLVVAEPVVRFDSGPLLVVILSRTSAVLDWRSQARFLVGLLVAVAVVAAIAARLLAGQLAKRLDEVAGAAGRLASGDGSARVAVSGTDEVTSLGVAFNTMADQLEASRRNERDFLLAVGHDLRTPLTTISGYAEALEESIDPLETKRIADVLGTETSRLRRLIEDLMLAARLGSQEFQLCPERVDVAAHLNEVCSGFAQRAQAERVRFRADLAATGTRFIDPDRIAQITSNLLENALRYTPEAGEVTVSLAVTDDRIELTVSDSGPGVEPEDLPHIFEKFYVAQRYRRVRPEGSGLGLSIVAQLVEKMGGRVAATSRPGSGTTVTVQIPAARV